MYRGRLDYVDSDDFIEVHSLIVRAADIAFELTTTWQGEGRWRASGAAREVSERTYASEALKLTRDGVPVVDTCKLKFEIIRQAGYELELNGAWIEKGLSHRFAGTLEST